MVAPLQDWGLIDESNGKALRDEIPLVRGSSKEYRLLNSTLDTMLEMKAVAIQNQVRVPGLSKLIEMYYQSVSQGKHLRQRGWWGKIRKMRDWHTSEDAFKTRCQAVWNLAHQTSFMVHTMDVHTDKSETIPGGSIRRRRSLDGLAQAEPNFDLIQPHNPVDDTPTRFTPPDVGLVAQSSSKNCINANTLQEETIRHIVEMSSAKTLEQFILHGRLSGWIPQTVNHFTGCIVRPGAGTGYTLNVGGKNNKGAVVNKCPSPTEVEGNGVDEIDDTSDDESHHDIAVGAT
ncbi:hypothetical protein P692DRAFT_20836428 [Suillus brevipes Sb2]|nr:hypothetical protein P692DRAFT_20836428 [Suillus brevipes Sb2]